MSGSIPWWQHAAGWPNTSQFGAGNYSPQNLNALMPWANQMPWAMPGGGFNPMMMQGLGAQGGFNPNLSMFGQAAQQPVNAPGTAGLAQMLQALMAQQPSQVSVPNPQTWQPTPNAAPAAQPQSPPITSLAQLQPPQPAAAAPAPAPTPQDGSVWTKPPLWNPDGGTGGQEGGQ